MRTRDAVVASFALAVTVACVIHVVDPPGPIYHPLERAWLWHKVPGAPLMAWYGRSLWSLGAGLVTLAIALPGCRRVGQDHPPPRWLVPLLGAVALIALVLALGNTVAHEYRTWIRR